MNYEQSERFLFIMAALAEATSQEASEMKIKIYAKALGDLSLDSIENACWQIIKTRKLATFPKVAEIRESISGEPETQALLALEKLEDAMRSIGRYRTVSFDDPAIHSAVEAFAGGWVAICEMQEDEWKWGRKEFMKLYQAFVKQPKSEVAQKLIGVHEHNNELAGREVVTETKYIGQPLKVAEIAPERLQGLLTGIGR